MRETTEILRRYEAGEIGLEEANRTLATMRAGFYLDPGRNLLTEEEKRATTVGYYPEQANGFGLLDTGTGFLDKVQIRSGVLVGGGCGAMEALCLVAGKTYRVKGDMLTD